MSRPVDKPLTGECYHYYQDDEDYVGAVWTEEDGKWSCFCVHPGNYGMVKEGLTSRQDAETQLTQAVGIARSHLNN